MLDAIRILDKTMLVTELHKTAESFVFFNFFPSVHPFSVRVAGLQGIPAFTLR